MNLSYLFCKLHHLQGLFFKLQMLRDLFALNGLEQSAQAVSRSLCLLHLPRQFPLFASTISCPNFTSKSFAHCYGKRRGFGSYATGFGSRALVTLSTIDTMHIRYHHHQRTIATSTDIEQRPHSSTTDYIKQRHLSRLGKRRLLFVGCSTLDPRFGSLCSEFASPFLDRLLFSTCYDYSRSRIYT